MQNSFQYCFTTDAKVSDWCVIRMCIIIISAENSKHLALDGPYKTVHYRNYICGF